MCNYLININNNGLLKSIYEYFDKIIEKNYKENLDQ